MRVHTTLLVALASCLLLANSAAAQCHDLDGDGFEDDACGGLDCDDGDPAAYPGAGEQCNGADDDCDGVVDEGHVSADWYPDGDGDGYGDRAATPIPHCLVVVGHVLNNGDCDDTDPAVHPAAVEQCNGVDDDCDGALSTAEVDADGDGVSVCQGDCDDGDLLGHPGAAEVCNGMDDDCSPTTNELWDGDGDGFTPCDDDCDDGEPLVYPTARESCDGLDNDCDATTDETVDSDGDGLSVCDGDCDDGDFDSHPGAVEQCDGADNDCDGAIPEDEDDNDDDGFMICDNDCDDTDADINPDATEECDGVDNDCSGAPDPGEVDADADGWMECQFDCDDSDPTAHPEAVEVCDGVDNDCDTLADEPDADDCVTYWADTDGDGYGDPDSSECLCATIWPHEVTNDDDCYDGNNDAWPGNTDWFTSHRGDASFDYDCDGVETQRYTTIGSCTDVDGVCTLVEGWGASVPDCAHAGFWFSSCAVNPNGVCQPSGSIQAQECN